MQVQRPCTLPCAAISVHCGVVWVQVVCEAHLTLPHVRSCAALQDETLKTARLDFVKLRQYEEVRAAALCDLLSCVWTIVQLCMHANSCNLLLHAGVMTTAYVRCLRR